MDAVSARFVRTGRHHPPFVRPRAYDERLSAPFGMVQELNGREKCVHIDVEKYRHGLNYTTKLFESLLLTVVATMWYTLIKILS
jgi:hypothetical protein